MVRVSAGSRYTITSKRQIFNGMEGLRDHEVYIHIPPHMNPQSTPITAWAQKVNADADFFTNEIDDEDTPHPHPQEITRLSRLQRLNLYADAPFTSFITANVGFNVTELEDGVAFIHGAEPRTEHSTPSPDGSDDQGTPHAREDPATPP